MHRSRAPRLAWAALAALAVFGCDDHPAGPGRSAVYSMVIDTTAMPLVRRVTIVMREAGPAAIWWVADGTPPLTMLADSSAFVHQFLVPRLRQGKAYTISAAGFGSMDAPVTEQFTTDSLPPALRAIAINQTGFTSMPLALVEVVGSSQFTGLLIIDDGQIVGWLPMAGSLFGATRRSNGNIVMLDAVLGLTEYRLDGTLVRRLPQPTDAVPTAYGRIHHDVIATPHNTLLFIALKSQVVGTDTIVGESVWEWSPESGAAIERWSAFDFLDWNTLRGSRSVPGNWLHGNGLSWGPRGNIVMSLRNADHIISIAPDFRSLEWSVGGPTATLGLSEADRFLGQHYVSEPSPGRLLVFDNGYERPGGGSSRAIEYELDLAGDTARKVWEYRHNPEIYAALVGSARRLPGGNTSVLFGMLAGHNGSSGPITAVEVTPGGEVRWRLTFGPQVTRLYRITPVGTLLGELYGPFSID